MSEIELADHFDRMNVVVSELLKGNNPTQIATVTGFKRAEVVELPGPVLPGGDLEKARHQCARW